MNGFEPQLVVQLVSQLGYPIVVSLLLMWYIYRVTLPLIDALRELKEAMEELRESHEQIMQVLLTFTQERDGVT